MFRAISVCGLLLLATGCASLAGSSVFEDGVVYQNDFNQHSIGPYSSAQFTADWDFSPGPSAGVADGRLSIVTDPDNDDNRVLRVRYNQGEVGGGSASVFTFAIPEAPHNELWLQYRVRFSDDFDWVKGGKLPGLAGFIDRKPTGCMPAEELEGFSARLMWRQGGRAVQYLYSPEKKARCGDDKSYATYFERGRWHTITNRVQLNDPGEPNGRIVAYLDGVEVLDLTGLNLRTRSDVTIDKLLFETFFGGSGADWAPERHEYADFDDIVISRISPLHQTYGNLD